MSKYNIVDRAKFTFYQIPKLLLHGEKYKGKLKANDILTYSILMDRLNVSIKNNWLDKNGNIYFVYSNKELCEILNISRPTLDLVKERLIDSDLLEAESTGRADRLYLLEPKVENTNEAKYIIKLDEKEIEDKSKFTKEEVETISKNLKQNTKSSTEDSKKLTTFGETPSNQGYENNDLPKIVRNLLSDSNKLTPSNNNLIRTKDIKDSKEISSTDKTHLELISNSFKEKDTETENKMIDTYIEEKSSVHIYGERLIREIRKMSRSDYDTFVAYMNKLEFAQQSVEKEENITIPAYDNNQYAEFTSDQLLSAFNRCMYQFRFGKVDNIESYLFISFKTVFKDLAMAVKQSIN